jgi:hypothetical protein
LVILSNLAWTSASALSSTSISRRPPVPALPGLSSCRAGGMPGAAISGKQTVNSLPLLSQLAMRRQCQLWSGERARLPLVDWQD